MPETDPCMWKGCSKRSSRGKNFCAEHVDELLESASKMETLLVAAATNIGWGIASAILYQLLKSGGFVPYDHPGAPQEGGEQYRDKLNRSNVTGKGPGSDRPDDLEIMKRLSESERSALAGMLANKLIHEKLDIPGT